MAVTREEVIWAYRLILGREPENEKVISEKLCQKNRLELSKLMLDSAEFANLNSGSPASSQRPSALVPLRPKTEIESQVDAATLARLWDHVRISWEELGSAHPHHSVLTSKKFLAGNFSDYEEEFWTSGNYDIKLLRDLCLSSGIDLGKLNTCLEYGCGVGRVSVKLAEIFRNVRAVDISRPHLAIAEQRAVALNLTNVEFQVIDVTFFGSLPEYDFLFSRIVLQHNPPPIMRYILERLCAQLNPSGAAVFQIPVYMKDYQFHVDAYLNAKEPGMEMHCLPQGEVIQLVQEAGGRVKEIREDHAIGRFGDWVSNTFVVGK